MKFLNGLIVLALFAGCSKSSSNTPASIHIISSAKADGVTNNASTLQQEIDSCHEAGPNGGTLELLPGKYVSTSLYMLSNVNLHLDAGAILVADTGANINADIALYTVNNKLVDFIRSGATALTNVSITGSGTIDGNGAPWWAAYNQNNSISRPRLVYITGCTNLTIDGITLKNSPSFHFVPYQCTNVIVNNDSIYATFPSPNTDGIDPSQCNGVTITNCAIDNGDDDIAIKAAGLCQNVTVKNCRFWHGHGLSIGSETNGGMNHLTVDSCTFNGTQYGIRLKSYTSAGGLMQNLSYSNIAMANVEYPIYINLDYQSDGYGTTYVPSVNGLSINNLIVTGSSNAGSLVGLSNSILQNITLSNVNISATNGMTISYANNVKMDSVVINGTTVTPLNSSSVITATNVTGKIGF